ncbi:MAG: glycerophosphodiester phosphodiesterase family protein [Bacteroidales bacterium]|nr:glycerophosphodiester phosphodiesterase family protein [Bacteroidales bacterium]
MKPTDKVVLTILFAVTYSLSTSIVAAQTQGKMTPDIQWREQLSDHFQYTGDGSVIISGHRGGREEGFPENSLEGFQNVLKQAPAIFEIDPRLTKDSIIVLMHDATLDRTTTGKGFLRDYTLDQLKSVQLKDSKGNVTPYSVPTLEEVITWSKNKTIVNLDKKDVPMEMIATLIKKLHAEDHVMVTVHTGAQARYYYDRFPDIMLSAFARTMAEYADLAISGVPWQNMIAYIGPTINSGNTTVVDSLHAHGVRCMISLAPTADKLDSACERQKAYLEEIRKQPDIIESDIPTEIWKALQVR